MKPFPSPVFASSLKANIDRYFKGITWNPREERRFQRDTVKREKLVAKKKNAPSVVPMNLINMDIAHQNLVTAITNLIANYRSALSEKGKTSAPMPLQQPGPAPWSSPSYCSQLLTRVSCRPCLCSPRGPYFPVSFTS